MVVKVYISGISGNKEVKKRQQRVMMILESKHIQYDVIDITEPGREADKDFMQNNAKSNGATVSDPNPRSALPPQLFNDEEYCGDYDQFDLANEVDTLECFLKVEVPPEPEVETEKTLNGDAGKESKENSQDRDVAEADKPVSEANENEKLPSREATPAERTADEPATTETKEGSPAKEASPEREKSVEKGESLSEAVEEISISKENAAETEAVNENGTVGSRDPSQEKEVIDTEESDRKKEPSELLIESEQAAAAE